MRQPPQRWPLASQVDRRAELLDRILERLGIPPAAAARSDEGSAIADARDACLHCSRARACERLLAVARPGAFPPSFCPNARFFQRFLMASH